MQVSPAADNEKTMSQPPSMGDAWIESPLSQPETSLQKRPETAAASQQEKSSLQASPLPRHEKAEERDASVGLSGGLLSAASSEPRAGSAASGDKGVKRLTEIERLLTLWAGDK